MSRRATPANVTLALLRAWPLPSADGSNSKEDRGRVLIVGGSRQIPGAALLAATAALRAGSGKLQIATARDAAVPLAIAVPEAMVMALPVTRDGDILRATAQLQRAAERTHAIVVGCGMNRTPATARVVRALLASTRAPVILDAGALDTDVVAAHAAADGAAPLILTPHAGEMAALLDDGCKLDTEAITADAQRIAAQFAFASNVVLVLKGPVTHIAAPDGRAWVHRGGTVGLGTSGSGDVLAGLIAGLAARGATPEQAAVWGVWLHARAGARLARRQGTLGFLAREIAAQVPALLDA